MALLQPILTLIESNVWIAWGILVVAFIILSKCADIFVDSSVTIAEKFKVPKLVIGIVMVSFATTTPELSVSLMSAVSGKPEMALGNAIGSVICDDGLALALAGVVTAAPIVIMPGVLKSSGVFLLCIEILAFLFVIFDNTLNRWEGIILVLIFFTYIGFLYTQHKNGIFKDDIEEIDIKEGASPLIAFLLFILSLAGIVISSKFIIVSATKIAHTLKIPETIIALTIVAFGTSIPEVATCVIASLKKHGAIAVGNIIGADIMNICWVAGASAIANPLVLGAKEIRFMFPAMFVIVGTMLAMLRYKYTLTRTKGIILFIMYLIYLYLVIFVMKFPLNS